MAQFRGFDCEQNITEYVPRIKELGYDFVAGYYSSNSRKVVTTAEITALSSAGIKFVAVYEDGNNPDIFTQANGKRHASVALELAQTHGQPPGGIIYFAVDVDIELDYIDDVMAYLSAAGTELGSYKVGVYASGLICTRALEGGLVVATWVTGAGGWAGSRDFKASGKWNINQHPTITEPNLGIQVDPDDAQGEYGGFLVSQEGTDPKPVPVVDPLAETVVERIKEGVEKVVDEIRKEL